MISGMWSAILYYLKAKSSVSAKMSFEGIVENTGLLIEKAEKLAKVLDNGLLPV